MDFPPSPSFSPTPPPNANDLKKKKIADFGKRKIVRKKTKERSQRKCLLLTIIVFRKEKEKKIKNGLC